MVASLLISYRSVQLFELAVRNGLFEQVQSRGYGTSSEYVRELIRRDQDRLQLRDMLLAGAESTPAGPVDTTYFDALRDRIRKTSTAKA